MKRYLVRACLLAGIAFLLVHVPAGAEPSLAPGEVQPILPAEDLKAFDTPGDEGRSITLSWISKSSDLLWITRSTSPQEDFLLVGTATASDETFVDNTVKDGIPYYYRIAYPTEADTVYSSVLGGVVPASNWFRTGRWITLVLTLAVFVLVVSFIQVAKRGKGLYIRKIAGLSAMEEAVGRATEMGKKMLYIPGILSISEIQTIASLHILKYVAQRTATYGAELEVPNIDPLTFSAARETVKQAYMEAGKPDQFKEDMVTYITYDQFAYTAAITGKMVREKPATNFFIGSFFAESLILAETGQSVGAIQIAGTAELAQLPFFVTACDYTLMGEELYAASAYLSHEPILLGSIRAQDAVKAALMAIILAGLVTLAFGWNGIRELLTPH
jgi:hypothetical protein